MIVLDPLIFIACIGGAYGLGLAVAYWLATR